MKPIPDVAGVYLFTFEYKDGYILRSVGVTKSMKKRFAEHTREYNNGNYSVLDVECAKRGVREELWHGWQYAKEHHNQFLEHKDFILALVRKELISYRLFITEIPDRRERERLEAAILVNTYGSKEPWADLVDGGMALRGRFNYETPIEIRNVCQHKVHGLPEIINI